MYETDRLPVDWVERCNAVDEVWVPSQFNVKTFSAAGVEPTKLFVVPAAVDIARFTPAPPCLEPRTRPFTFLSVFKWQYRKGWDLLLRAFTEAFDPQDDVQLILHVLPLPGTVFDPAREIRRLLGEKALSSGRSITVSQRALTPPQLPPLYHACDAFVLASRGEGCGRPYLEAMASGLPTIGTRWSGNLAFMNDATSMLIDAAVVDVSDAASREWPLFAGHRWAEPDVDHLIALMRRCASLSAADLLRLGRRARASVALHHTTHQAATRVIQRLQAIAPAPAHHP